MPDGIKGDAVHGDRGLVPRSPGEGGGKEGVGAAEVIVRREKNRLTVVEQVNFQEAGNPTPVVVDARYSAWLESEEQVYQRRINVRGDWQLIDLGWLSGCCSMVVLRNERRKFATVPTEGQQAEADGAVVEVSFEGSDSTVAFSINPDRDARVPCPNLWMSVRCRLGSARLHITAFPE